MPGLRLRNFLITILILVCMASLLAGCTKNASNEASVNASKLSPRDLRIENNSLVVAIGSEPEAGFDSTTGGHGSITRLIFSTLFKRDKALGWENDLATGYVVSDDKLIWTVSIRDDVFFTDGSKVTAYDVAYTYETAKNAGADVDLTMIEAIKAVDERTVEFSLVRPYSTFIERLAYLGIIPKDKHDERFKDNPIGSGPFKFVQWDKGQQIIFESNENYHGDVPKIKQLTLVFLDRDVAFAAIKNGSVDVAAITGILAKQAVDGANVIDLPSIECYGVCFPVVKRDGRTSVDGATVGNDVTSDIFIRKALNAAVDRNKIVNGIFHGYASVSTTGLEKMPWLNEATVLSDDEFGSIELGRSILKEGGWVDIDGDGIAEKDGIKASFNLLYTGSVFRQELALEFANVAKQIGIEVNLKQTTWDTILPDIHKDAVLYGFGSGDPSELYNLYYGGIAGGVVPWDNSGYYDNPLANEQIELALMSTDENEAIKHWKALQNYASPVGDAPYVWLANANHVYLVADGFSFGQPLIQPHGGRILDNANEWCWN